MSSSESSSSSSSESSAPNTPKVKKNSIEPSSDTPKASKETSESTLKDNKDSDTLGASEKESRSPSSSPKGFTKGVDSPAEEHKSKESNSPESLKKLPQLPPISCETPNEKESKPLNSHTRSENVIAPTKEDNKSQSDSTSPSDPAAFSKGPQRKSFKSSLQIMLKRQELELHKNIEYKEKVERGELDDEEEEGGNGDRRGGGGGGDGSKEGRAEEKGKEDNDNASKGKAKADEAKGKIKKTERSEDEDVEEKRKKKEKTKKKIIEGKKDKEKKKEVEEKKAKERKEEEKEVEGKKKKEVKEEEKKEVEGKEKKEVEEKEKKKVEEKEKIKVEEKEKKEEEGKEKKEVEKKKKDMEEKQERMDNTTASDEKPMKSKEEEKGKTKKEKAQEAVAVKKEEQQSEETEARSRKKKEAREKKTQGPMYMKRKRTFNPWKEYYFVLDDLLLTYYSSQQQYDHLSGMKGSLDLSLVEEVHQRKPGLMKKHHPFCLARRNLPSIHLASATKEDQERWMNVLRSAIRPHRLSSHSSENALLTASASSAAAAAEDAIECKAATLPARVKHINRCSSSIDEDDEEDEKEVKKEEDEKEVKEEEEPELIKPKKVLKVPVGLPMAAVNLGAVKLKKLEKAEAKRDDEGEKTTTAAAAAAGADNKTQDSRETSPAEMFGVVLKKTKRKEEEEGAKEAARDATPATSATTPRRPSKQPVIPLNSGKLLVVPEVKTPKTSPPTPRQHTPERKKSPSPSLPISKSVQALTKSAEEVKETQCDDISAEPSPSSSMITQIPATPGKDKASGVKLCHAQTSEVKYANVEAMHVEDEVVEVQAARRQDAETEKTHVAQEEDVEEAKGARRDVESVGKVTGKKVINEEKNQREDTVAVGEQHHKAGEDAATKARLQGSHMDIVEENKLDEGLHELKATKAVSEGLAEDQQREENSEEAAMLPPKISRALTPLTPPASPSSSQASASSDKLSVPSSPVPPLSESSSSSVKSGSSSPKSTPTSPKSSASLSKSPTLLLEGRGSEEERQENLQDVKGTDQQEKTEKVVEHVEEEHWEAHRHRSNTNESTASSGKEGGEKKPGKLQILKKKLKSGAPQKEEEPVSPKEPKKRRGSNTFSKLLTGKKKNEGKKHVEEEQHPQASQGEAANEPPPARHPTAAAAPQHAESTLSTPPPAEASPLSCLGQPRLDVQEADSLTSRPAENSLSTQMDNFLNSRPSPEDAKPPSVTAPPSGEACHDTHSHLSYSSWDDQPPSIPEKTRIRAHSPNHDVPKSNRPVTYLDVKDTGDEDEDGDEVSPTVDGYITEEQIDALLNAKQNREKRKQSKSGTQLLLAVPDTVKGATLPSAAPVSSAEDWSSKRPPFSSFSSIDSDESLPVTNFLGANRSSSSSGSLRCFRKSLEADGDEHTSLTTSESGESLSPEAEVPAEPQRRGSRPTDAIIAKNRLSLTSPEFTVKEEEGLSSPEISKAKSLYRGSDDGEDKRQQKTSDEAKAEVEANTKAEIKTEAKADSEAEEEDFFPIVGRDVQLRQPTVPAAAFLDLHKDELRMSGINSLKEYLRAQEEDEGTEEVKSGISRLGHSAAVEKLKQASSE